jgi:hypothetical protein
MRNIPRKFYKENRSLMSTTKWIVWWVYQVTCTVGIVSLLWWLFS